MKRAGRHRAREPVNPLLARRSVECNGRWASAGPARRRAHRARCLAQRRARHCARRLAHRAPPSSPAPPPRPPAPHPWRRYTPGWLSA
jgi:hypothetical protein